MKKQYRVIAFLSALFLASCGDDMGENMSQLKSKVYKEGPKGRSELVLSFSGLKSSDGNMCVSVFDEAGDFPSDEGAPVFSGCFEIAALSSGIKVELPAGKYAAAVFHDENANGKLDKKRIFGIKVPKEPFGFSNNPKIKMSAPKFEDCAFNLGLDSNVALNIELKKI